MISNNGNSFNTFLIDDNAKPKSFKFIERDILSCEFNPIDKSILFEKYTPEEKKVPNVSFTTKIDIPANQEICACVNLANKNDSVEIKYINDS